MLEGESGSNKKWWRWIGLVVIVALLANVSILPWPVLLVLLVGGGGFLIFLGWRTWNGGRIMPEKKRVSYWRGQRIELVPPSRRTSFFPPLRTLLPALPYILIGLALVLGGIGVLVRHLGA